MKLFIGSICLLKTNFIWLCPIFCIKYLFCDLGVFFLIDEFHKTEWICGKVKCLRLVLLNEGVIVYTYISAKFNMCQNCKVFACLIFLDCESSFFARTLWNWQYFDERTQSCALISKSFLQEENSNIDIFLNALVTLFCFLFKCFARCTFSHESLVHSICKVNFDDGTSSNGK